MYVSLMMLIFCDCICFQLAGDGILYEPKTRRRGQQIWIPTVRSVSELLVSFWVDNLVYFTYVPRIVSSVIAIILKCAPFQSEYLPLQLAKCVASAVDDYSVLN